MKSVVAGAKQWLKRPLYAAERKLYLSGVASLERLTLPHFLGLGPTQAGTTWLHFNLMRHPDVFVPDKKEVHYFSRSFHRWPLSYYSFLFEEGRTRRRGEICPGYNMLDDERIRFIASIMPDVRLFLTLRNPIDRAWSSARRHLTKLAKRLGKDFDELEDSQFYEFFRNEYSSLPGSRRSEGLTPGMLHSHYCDAIDHWRKYFKSGQLLVLFFDDIATDPRQYLRKVCEHIGARTDFEWDREDLNVPVNTNPVHPLPERFRAFLEDFYAGELDALENRFGKPVRRWR